VSRQGPKKSKLRASSDGAAGSKERRSEWRGTSFNKPGRVEKGVTSKTLRIGGTELRPRGLLKKSKDTKGGSRKIYGPK